MAIGPPEWIGIAAIGAGGLMGILGKRIVAIVGTIIVLVGMIGLGASLYYGHNADQAAATTITNPQDSNIVVGPTSGSINQTIINPLKAAAARSLTDAQKKAIAAALAEAPPASLFIPYVNSKEALGFMGQFRKLFADRGWKFMDFSGSSQRPEPQKKIIVGWRNRKSASYNAVIKGLRAANIDFAESEFELSGEDQDKDIIAFQVGVIPMTDLQLAIDRDE